MKFLPVVVVMVVLTIVMGVGMAPLGGDSGGDGQTAIEEFSPSYATDTTSTVQTGASGDGSVLNVLALPSDSIERSDLRRQYADLGPAAGFDTAGTTNQLVTRSLESELESTASESERQERIDQELAEIEDGINELESKEQAAIRGFSNGELEPRELVTELAAVHLEAGALRDRTQMLESQADSLDENTVTNERLQQIEYDLRMLESPLRAHAVSVLRAERPANRIMIEAGNNEIALSAIDDDEYIREANRRGLRGTGQNTLTPERAEEITEQQYPTLWNRSTSWSSDGSESVFMMSVLFERGELRTFIDGPSERTFIEHQQIPLESIEIGESTNKVQDGLNVTVDQTYAGGPLRITVTDADSGEPVAATVTVGQDGQESQPVGTTDENGVVWAVSPRDQFTITVLGDGTSAAFVDITPPSPESVTGSQ